MKNQGDQQTNTLHALAEIPKSRYTVPIITIIDVFTPYPYGEHGACSEKRVYARLYLA